MDYLLTKRVHEIVFSNMISLLQVCLIRGPTENDKIRK